VFGISKEIVDVHTIGCVHAGRDGVSLGVLGRVRRVSPRNVKKGRKKSNRPTGCCKCRSERWKVAGYHAGNRSTHMRGTAGGECRGGETNCGWKTSTWGGNKRCANRPLAYVYQPRRRCRCCPWRVRVAIGSCFAGLTGSFGVAEACIMSSEFQVLATSIKCP
jgi:hypothetical protein